MEGLYSSAWNPFAGSHSNGTPPFTSSLPNHSDSDDRIGSEPLPPLFDHALSTEYAADSFVDLLQDRTEDSRLTEVAARLNQQFQQSQLNTASMALPDSLPTVFSAQSFDQPSNFPSQTVLLNEYRKGHQCFMQLYKKAEGLLSHYQLQSLDLDPSLLQNSNPEAMPLQCERIYSLILMLMNQANSMQQQALSIASKSDVVVDQSEALSSKTIDVIYRSLKTMIHMKAQQEALEKENLLLKKRIEELESAKVIYLRNRNH